jgi:hypothetical protein
VIWWCGLNRKAAPSPALHTGHRRFGGGRRFEVGVVTEAAFCRGEVADAGSGHVVFVVLGNFFEREILFLRFVGTRVHIPVVVYV